MGEVNYEDVDLEVVENEQEGQKRVWSSSLGIVIL
jgi:hypothetical protein